MQRVPSVLVKPSFKAPTHHPLVPNWLIPTGTVPYSESRRDVPVEWTWSEAAPSPVSSPTTATFAPLAYESGYEYPLIVWLHSDGANEDSLPLVMKHISLRNFVAVAPRGVEALAEGYGWSQFSDCVDAAEDAVFEAIDSTRDRFSVHTSRVFLVGSGSGGAMAMRIALRHPDRFAGVATLDGALPTGDALLCRVNEARQLPLLLSASKCSIDYPESRMCRDLALLHSAGCRVAIRQYPGNEDLTTEMLADVNRWAMQIVCE
ncbi:Phospholipase/Carboxylesterase [Planctomycetes bacterium K2D]|uniref:Phospholipase/Carboxylesterase n=2 Tax=Botrimarina mediterranea TaxID=2528022 RepID=A0A518KBT9_9BACT|nr:Phospholipase/Carboxylesterase [Botrimarina mediterranea]QDV79907.1 Phospholipase/Carboxylesterase [Planctomycetes bacterium K2D]